MGVEYTSIYIYAYVYIYIYVYTNIDFAMGPLLICISIYIDMHLGVQGSGLVRLHV